MPKVKKQRADDGLDYTPASSAAWNRSNPRVLEHVVFTQTVRQQHYPLFNVVTKGKTVEWTDLRSEAHSAYRMANAPKSMFLHHANGSVKLLEQQLT